MRHHQHRCRGHQDRSASPMISIRSLPPCQTFRAFSAAGISTTRGLMLASSAPSHAPMTTHAPYSMHPTAAFPKRQLQPSCWRNSSTSASAAGQGARIGTSMVPAVKVPHAGYHYDGTPRRFFEGWYWKVQIPNTPESFALIFSIEDPDGANEFSGVGVQVMGPGDGYICQFSRDTACFWADRNDLALGAGVKARAGAPQGQSGRGGNGANGSVSVRPGRMLDDDQFFQQVEHGFQASYTQHTGSIIASEKGAAGASFSTVSTCSWALTIQPASGWGTNASPKATAGWLSVLSVFEPHWQVLMAHGLASGWIDWGGRRYDFADAPAYAEKNWGGGFPSKWAWIQCNSFDGHPGLSVTAVGARRALALGLPGIEEDVGLIGVHLPDSAGGQFVELVPWTGDVEWEVEPWGKWLIRARNAEYEAMIEATCAPTAGTTLRAPTISQGLAPFCRDTFFGTCRLRVWRREQGGGRPWAIGRGRPVVDASTTSAALEVGGGPWWCAWSATAAMKEPFRSLVQLPIDVGALGSIVPGPLKPPGL